MSANKMFRIYIFTPGYPPPEVVWLMNGKPVPKLSTTSAEVARVAQPQTNHVNLPKSGLENSVSSSNNTVSDDKTFPVMSPKLAAYRAKQIRRRGRRWSNNHGDASGRDAMSYFQQIEAGSLDSIFSNISGEIELDKFPPFRLNSVGINVTSMKENLPRNGVESKNGNQSAVDLHHSTENIINHVVIDTIDQSSKHINGLRNSFVPKVYEKYVEIDQNRLTQNDSKKENLKGYRTGNYLEVNNNNLTQLGRLIKRKRRSITTNYFSNNRRTLLEGKHSSTYLHRHTITMPDHLRLLSNRNEASSPSSGTYSITDRDNRPQASGLMVSRSLEEELHESEVTTVLELGPLTRSDNGKMFSCRADNSELTPAKTRQVTVSMIRKYSMFLLLFSPL